MNVRCLGHFLTSDVLGWAWSSEPAELSPFKPGQSPALTRAPSGLRPGLRSQKPEPAAQAWASTYGNLVALSSIGKAYNGNVNIIILLFLLTWYCHNICFLSRVLAFLKVSPNFKYKLCMDKSHSSSCYLLILSCLSQQINTKWGQVNYAPTGSMIELVNMCGLPKYISPLGYWNEMGKLRKRKLKPVLHTYHICICIMY